MNKLALCLISGIMKRIMTKTLAAIARKNLGLVMKIANPTITIFSASARCRSYLFYLARCF